MDSRSAAESASEVSSAIGTIEQSSNAGVQTAPSVVIPDHSPFSPAQAAAVPIATADPPPIAHAIGGSLGSALALLLLYPLERARIELQSLSAQRENRRSTMTFLSATRTTFQGENFKSTTGLKEKKSFFPVAAPAPAPFTQRKQQQKNQRQKDMNVDDMLQGGKRGRSSPGSVGVVLGSYSIPEAAGGGSDRSSSSSPSSDSWVTTACYDQDLSPVVVVNNVMTNTATGTVIATTADTSDTINITSITTSFITSLQDAQRKLNHESIEKPRKRTQELKWHQQKRQEEKEIGLVECIFRLYEKCELYKGVTPVVSTIAISNFVFFYTHQFMKQMIMTSSTNQQGTTSTMGTPSMSLSLLASSIAGIINVLTTNPLWVANLRIVTGEAASPSLFRELIHITQKEGVPSLWNGTCTSLLLVCNPVIQFFAYEQLKNIWQQRLRGFTSTSSKLTPLKVFLLGALAKAIATVLTYPLQLTQTLLRVQQKQQKQICQTQDLATKNDNDGDMKPFANDLSSLSPSHIGTSSGTYGNTNSNKEVEQINSTKNYNDGDKKPITKDSPSSSPSYIGTSSGTDGNRNINKEVQHFKGTWDCLIKIFQTKGFKGLFAGMNAKLLQTVLTAAFTFLTYEQILRLVQIAQALIQK